MPPQTLNFEGIPDAASKSGGLNFDGIPDAAPADTPRARLNARRAKIAEHDASLKGTEPVLQALEGAGRGAISTVQGLASPIRKAFGMKPATPPEKETTTAGKVGRFAEQTAEFLTPEGASEALATKVPKIAKAATKSVVSGAGSYALAKAQGDEHPVVAGLIGAGGPLVEMTAPAAYKLLRTGAKAGLAKVLGASTVAPEAVNAAVRKVVPVALDEGLKPTWASWLKQRSGAKTKAGVALKDAMDGPLGSSLVSTKPVIAALDELADSAARHVMKAEETVAGATGKVPAGDLVSGTVVYNKRLMKAINDIKTTLKQHGDVVQARQLVDLKRSWDEFVYKANDFPNTKKILIGLEAKAKHAAANAIRGVLDSDVPKIADLDKAYSLSVRLHDLVRKAAVGEEVGVATGKAASRVANTFGRKAAVAASGATAGAGLGYERTHSATGAAIGGLIGGASARMLESALSSPAWRTAPAALKNALADAISSGQANKVRKLLTPLLVKIGAGSPDAK